MSEQAIGSRVSRLEGGQAELLAWRQEMQEASREFWRRDEALGRGLEETRRLIQQASEEASLRGADLDRRFQETDRMIKQASEEARRRGEELDRRFQEDAAEARRRSEERERDVQETRRMIKTLGQQIGGLGQKFGGFTEGLAAPSMERRLAERFGTTRFMVRPRVRLGDEELEVDALAYSVGESGTVCAVDVKSRLRDEGIDQLLRSLEKFPRFFPEHRGKRLIGVLAVVDLSRQQEERILRAGLVLARISGEVFEIRIPEGYEPRAFPNPAVPVA